MTYCLLAKTLLTARPLTGSRAVVIGYMPRGWVAPCLTCGLASAEREDGLEAKLAFDDDLDALT